MFRGGAALTGHWKGGGEVVGQEGRHYGRHCCFTDVIQACEVMLKSRASLSAYTALYHATSSMEIGTIHIHSFFKRVRVVRAMAERHSRMHIVRLQVAVPFR